MNNYLKILMVSAFVFSVSGLFAEPDARDEPPPSPYQQRYPRQPYSNQQMPPPPPPPPQSQYPQNPGRPYPQQQPYRQDGFRQQPQQRGSHRQNDKWQVISQQRAAGSAKEVSFNGYSQCKIECTGGRVVLNTVVVRRGGKKQSITARASLGPGQEWNVPVDQWVTGIRISDGGGGTYRVCCR